MKIKMMILALSMLSCSAANAGQAGIQLCDNVTLDNDSVHGWGCWTALDPTAAGPTGGSQMGTPKGDAYRTLPAFSQAPDQTPSQPPSQSPTIDGKFACPAGAVCGYTVYWNYNNTSEKATEKGPYPAYFIAYPKTKGEGEGGGQLKVRYTLVQINPDDPAPRFANSGNLRGEYDSNEGWAEREGNNGKYAWIDGQLDETRQLVTGYQYIEKYVTGGESERGDHWRGSYSYYVAGIQTPADAMASLASGGKTATYTGRELSSGNEVRIKVDFGQGSWNGAWDHQTSKGLKIWNAEGTISGANIQSTGISGHFTNGQVQGSFYGPQAGALAGVADVYRVKNNGKIDRHVDVFATTTTGFNGGGGRE